MNEFFEIDFLEVGEKGSGDAICMRYTNSFGDPVIHVIDGGYSRDGQKLADHIRQYYGNPHYIASVVLTHPDGDHAAGLLKILDDFSIGSLWMNRPWVHAQELLPRFNYEYTYDGLVRRLRKDFPHTKNLEDKAVSRGITIHDAFQGQYIGNFIVLSPSKEAYLKRIVESERTPEAQRLAVIEGNIFDRGIRFVQKVFSEWGKENLKGETEGTSEENETSIVQYAVLNNEKILLTGDCGVNSLNDAYDYSQLIGISLPGIDRFDVPHHGSRRNLSTEALDKWLGPRLPSMPNNPTFTAIVSANREDPNHPRKAVVRALIHRGGNVIPTTGTIRTSKNAPARDGWSPMAGLEYPNDMEE